MAEENELWIHQEGVLISADSHDIWRFTPDFLVSSEIVPEDWVCGRSVQSTEEVTIQFGPSRWRMSARNLWISIHPDRSLRDDLADGSDPLVPILANNFLVASPFLPSKRLWHFWRISAVTTDRNEWKRSTFLAKRWPGELGVMEVQPRLVVSFGNAEFHLTIRDDLPPGRGRGPLETVTFDCYAGLASDQTPDNMISDVTFRTERLVMLERVVRQLLGNGGQL